MIPEPAPSGDGPVLLVVEDEEESLSALCTVLAREGYRVLQARTGLDGLRIARQQHPHAILMDLGLPGLNGLDVARLLHGEPETAGIPIVALTGSWLAEHPAKLRDAGFASALRKPFGADVLLSHIRGVLDGGGQVAGGQVAEAGS